MEGGHVHLPWHEHVWVPVSRSKWLVLTDTDTLKRNCFFLYGAQGPTAFSNGPTCVEVQGDWIVDAMKMLRDQKIDYCEASHEAEKQWREKVMELSDKTLFPQTKASGTPAHHTGHMLILQSLVMVHGR
jgi:hypothetical protein